MTYKHNNKIKWHTYVLEITIYVLWCFINDNICPLTKRHICTFNISFTRRIIFNANVHVIYYKPPNTRIQRINASCTPLQRKSVQNTVDDCSRGKGHTYTTVVSSVYMYVYTWSISQHKSSGARKRDRTERLPQASRLEWNASVNHAPNDTTHPARPAWLARHIYRSDWCARHPKSRKTGRLHRERRHGSLCRWIKAAEPPPDDRFLSGEPSNTVRARFPWLAQPYMTSRKYANRGLLLCLESMW